MRSSPRDSTSTLTRTNSRLTHSGFSLVEILVAVSIIATLSIVAYVSTQGIQSNRYNSKRVADVVALTNALETHLVQTKTLPEPTANRQYYSSGGSYSHSATGAFGVSSSFSEDILGKYALTNHPRDPDTGSYYIYGKSFESTSHYEIAAVLKPNGVPTAYVRGNYEGNELPSLVK